MMGQKRSRGSVFMLGGALCVLVLSCVLSQEPRSIGEGRTARAYPETRTVEQSDVYHGMEVADPYRWLEDLGSEGVRRWVRAQNEFTRTYLEVSPSRDRILRRLEELWDYEQLGFPQRRQGRTFFTYDGGESEPSGLFYTDGADDEWVLLYDTRQRFGASTERFVDFEAGPDGAFVAYAISDRGSDWRTWYVLDVATGKVLDDVVRWNKLGIQWKRDGSGFFYTRRDVPREDAKLLERNDAPDIYFHHLGTSQDADSLVHPRPEEGVFQAFFPTEDGRFLVLTRWRGFYTSTYYLDLEAEGSERGPFPVVEGYDASHLCIGTFGDTFVFRTDLEAPNGKIVAVDRRRPARENWRILVPEGELPLEGGSLIGGRMIITYTDQAVSKAYLHGLDGKRLEAVDLGVGTVDHFWGCLGEDEAHFRFTSFTRPPVIAAYNVRTGVVRTLFEPRIDFDGSDYETHQVYCTSRDGTGVPIFLTHRSDLELDGSNPAYLQGYGAFGHSVKPTFSIGGALWLEMGGVLAAANLRGGGRYGGEWHTSGTRLEKQNTFDDYIAAAEWLCERGYTSPDKLVGAASSAGGLTVAVCLTQRPDLFGATVVDVALTDMLRYSDFTVGDAWTSEFGSPEDPDEFRALYAYSPLHNVRAGKAYPPTLVMTSDRDDRVVPSHSYKLVAALQAAQSHAAPILLRVETDAGHDGASVTADRLAAAADMWAFLCEALELEPPPGW